MKISINQPYFFPYIGYFQLISSSDIFINLDHVQYTKRSYITSNTLKNDIKINIPVIGGSQTKQIREVYADCTEKWFENFAKTLYINYGKEPYFCDVMEEVLSSWYEVIKIQPQPISISEFNMISIYIICKYLDIQTKFSFSSLDLTNQKREKGLQDIVKYYKGDTYINAIGGQKLYTKDNFKEAGIDLYFIKNKSLLPNTSILDLLFRFDKELIKQELNNYELV